MSKSRVLAESKVFLRVLSSVIVDVEHRDAGSEFSQHQVFESMKGVQGKGGQVFALTLQALMLMTELGDLDKMMKDGRWVFKKVSNPINA